MVIRFVFSMCGSILAVDSQYSNFMIICYYLLFGITYNNYLLLFTITRYEKILILCS